MSAEKAAAVAAPDAKPEKDEDDEDAEGFSGNAEGLLAESVTKDEWKSIEASLTYNKKTVAEMLKRACGQVRHKGEILIDDSNGKFLGDMLPEMDNFSNWCYKEHIRPKLLSLPLELPEEEEGDAKKKKSGGPKKGPPKKGGGGGKEEKIPAKQQIKIDNVMRIMNGATHSSRASRASHASRSGCSVRIMDGAPAEGAAGYQIHRGGSLQRSRAAASSLTHAPLQEQASRPRSLLPSYHPSTCRRVGEGQGQEGLGRRQQGHRVAGGTRGGRHARGGCTLGAAARQGDGECRGTAQQEEGRGR